MADPASVAVPLAGVRVVTTRGASGDDRLRSLLEAAGARVLAWPTCAYPPPRDPAPLEAALARLDRFDWVVFTSARAVAAMGEGRAHRAARSATAAGGAPSTPRVAVVGPATARAATEAGWAVAVEGRGPGARGLAAEVAATHALAGARVLFPAASRAGSTVEEEFTALGARVTRVEAYRTVVTPPPADRVRADLVAGVDAVAFASPSAVEAVGRALGGEMAGLLAGVAVVCIGPTTAAALARRGVTRARVAPTATLGGMVEAVIAVLRGSRRAAGGTGGRSDAAAGRRGTPLGGRASGTGGRSSSRVRGRRELDAGRAPSRGAIQSRGAGRPDAGLGRAANARAAATTRAAAATRVAGRRSGARR